MAEGKNIEIKIAAHRRSSGGGGAESRGSNLVGSRGDQ